VPAGKLSRFTPSYWTDFQTGQIVEYDPLDGAWARPPAFPGGGAGLVSTVDDYLAFAGRIGRDEWLKQAAELAGKAD